MEPWKVTIIVAVISVLSGSVTAIVNAVIDRVKKKRDKKDSAEQIMDKLNDLDATLKDVVDRVSGLELAEQILMQDRIRHLATKYCEVGEITFDQYKDLKRMHDCYHNTLHGNGFLDAVMEDVNSLPKVQ